LWSALRHSLGWHTLRGHTLRGHTLRWHHGHSSRGGRQRALALDDLDHARVAVEGTVDLARIDELEFSLHLHLAQCGSDTANQIVRSIAVPIFALNHEFDIRITTAKLVDIQFELTG
jgi:hypothetical protein